MVVKSWLILATKLALVLRPKIFATLRDTFLRPILSEKKLFLVLENILRYVVCLLGLKNLQEEKANSRKTMFIVLLANLKSQNMQKRLWKIFNSHNILSGICPGL